jgi:hypothetical protein
MIHKLWVMIALVLLAGPALACECRQVPLDEKIRAATNVIQGEVVYPYQDQPENITAFRVTGAIKGVHLVKPRIANNAPDGDPACAAEFLLGQRYDIMVFGTYESGYYTDACNSQHAEKGNIKLLMQMFTMRAKNALDLVLATPDLSKLEGLELVDVRKRGEAHLRLENFEMALRMYARAAQVSRNSWVDLLGQGKAYLKLMMATLALERFDDVLEKKPENKEAWSGRYQALALLDRWKELPAKADLTGFWWRNTKLSSDLDAPIFAAGWWDLIDASGRKLAGANFNAAVLTSVNFNGADLTDVSFENARLREVDFSGANLTGAKLSTQMTQIKWDKNTRWPEGFDPQTLSALHNQEPVKTPELALPPAARVPK